MQDEVYILAVRKRRTLNGKMIPCVYCPMRGLYVNVKKCSKGRCRFFVRRIQDRLYCSFGGGTVLEEPTILIGKLPFYSVGGARI